jgi:hypothetical protein
VPIPLAMEIVTGQLLYASDLTLEAEYQLQILRKSAEISGYEKIKEKLILEG